MSKIWLFLAFIPINDIIAGSLLTLSQIEEVADVVVKNGFFEVNLVALQENSDNIRLIKELEKRNVKIKFLLGFAQNGSNEILAGNFIIHTVENEEQWIKAVQLASHIRFHSAIVISSMENLSNLPTLNINVHLYLYTTENSNWQEVVMLKNSSNKTLISKIGEKCEKKLNPSYNFQGSQIKSMSMDWEPFAKFSNCDELGRNCRISGILGKTIVLVEKMLNLSISADIEIHGNWGSRESIISSNLSGVTGKVYNGDAQISIGCWFMTAWRSSQFDLILIMHTSKRVLITFAEGSEIDFGLFLRPFSKELWIFIIVISILTLIIITAIFKFHKGNINRWSFRLALLSTTILWMVLNAFFAGALTMFFSNESDPIFENVREVMENFPDWKIVVIKGDEIVLDILREREKGFSEIWKNYDEFPENFIVKNAKEGLKMMKTSQVVMDIDQEILRDAINEEDMGKMEFQLISETTYNLPFASLVTKNSPLTPALQWAYMKLLENGANSQAENRHMLKIDQKTSRIEDAATVLAPGQLIIVYLIMALGIVVSLIVFGCEKIFKRFSRRHS